MRGLYIHIPFCARKCGYCDFYSVPGKAGLLGPYVDALLQEATMYRGMKFDTLYIGGGTPSLLSPSLLDVLIKGLTARLNLGNLLESTIEVNPESAGRELLQAARSAGINRLSIGVQSLDDTELRKAGRIHNAAAALGAIDTAVKCGFTNISADIIIGLPGQTSATLVRTLDQITCRPLTHLSAYCLSVEEGTPFSENTPADLVDDDGQAALFDEVGRYLKGQGLVHYEISNFARPGKECLHNLNYWRGGEYVGLGPAAASHLGGRRTKNAADLGRYLENPLSMEIEIDELPPADRAAEEAMLRLRLLEEGLCLSDLERHGAGQGLADLRVRLENMAREKALIRCGDTYRIPSNGVLTSNRVFARVLS